MTPKKRRGKTASTTGLGDWWHGTTAGVRGISTFVGALLVIAAGVGGYTQWINWFPASVWYVDYKVTTGLESTQRSVWDLQIDNLQAQYGDTRKDIVQQKAKLAVTRSADERVRVEAQIDDLERLKKKQSDKITDLEKKLGR